MATILVKVKAKTVAKTLQHVEVEGLVDKLPHTLSDRVAKKIQDTLTCVEAEQQVNKIVEAEALFNTTAYTFSHWRSRILMKHIYPTRGRASDTRKLTGLLL